MIESGNLFGDVPARLPTELVTPLLVTAKVRIECIVSRGHASPPDFWHDQAQPEWVAVLSGSAGLLFEGEDAPRALKRGDFLQIPAHARHRVAWTDDQEPTIWLAVHYE